MCGCGERTGLCVYVCKVGVSVCGETGVSLCGCGTTGLGVDLQTWVWFSVWKTGVRVYVLVCAGKLGCVCVGRDGFVCACVERLWCVCGERDWRRGGRIGGVVEGETGRLGGRFKRGVEGVRVVCVPVCVVIG